MKWNQALEYARTTRVAVRPIDWEDKNRNHQDEWVIYPFWIKDSLDNDVTFMVVDDTDAELISSYAPSAKDMAAEWEIQPLNNDA